MACLLAPPAHAAPQASSAWVLRPGRDPMTDAPFAVLTLRSFTVHQLAWPYNGGSQLYLVIRIDRGAEPSVRVFIDRGQLDCSPCDLPVRVDEGEVTSWHAHTDSGDHQTARLTDSAGAVEALRTAQHLRLAVPLFGSGERVFHFAPTGLVAALQRAWRIAPPAPEPSAPSPNPEPLSTLEQAEADAPVDCTGTEHCAALWARARDWLARQAAAPVPDDPHALTAPEQPLGGWSLSAYRMGREDGTARIVLAVACRRATPCISSPERLRAEFHRFLRAAR